MRLKTNVAESMVRRGEAACVKHPEPAREPCWLGSLLAARFTDRDEMRTANKCRARQCNVRLGFPA
jgi:hypothetical protein